MQKLPENLHPHKGQDAEVDGYDAEVDGQGAEVGNRQYAKVA